jgi:sialidase-1
LNKNMRTTASRTPKAPLAIDHKERIHLFKAREGGYHHYRVPSCVVSPGGVAMVFTEARKNTRDGQSLQHADYWDIDILMRRSSDGGRSWEERRMVVDHGDFGPGPIHNFTPIADPGANNGRGCVHALFGHDYARLFAIRSDDDGLTWSGPREITDVVASIRDRFPWTAFATGPGHAICKECEPARGRLVVPVWMCATPKGQGDPHRPSDLTLLTSDDHGETWQMGPTVLHHLQEADNGVSVGTPNETSAVELPDGSILFNTRNESVPPRRVTTVSADGGATWSQPRFEEGLFDPQCHGSILGMPDLEAVGGQALLFVNPDAQTKEMPGNWGGSYDRRNLSARISRDNGATWQPHCVIEPGPSGYCDLMRLPDGSVWCVFECGMIDTMTDTRNIAVQRVIDSTLDRP